MNRWTVLPSDLRSGDTIQVHVQTPATGRMNLCEFTVKSPLCLVLEGAAIVPVTPQVSPANVVPVREGEPAPTIDNFYGKTLVRVATAAYDYNSDSGRTVFYFSDGTTLAVRSEAEMAVETSRLELIERKEWHIHPLEILTDTDHDQLDFNK